MSTHDKLIELMRDFDTAMLVTKTEEGGLDARPMAVAEVTDGGSLWFVTDRRSGKIDDLIRHGTAGITMQGSRKYVSITGTVNVVDDRARVEELWSEGWEIWFPGGKDHPAITLLQFIPEHGEYWDNSGFVGIKYLIKAGKAYLQGERPVVDQAVNATVSLAR